MKRSFSQLAACGKWLLLMIVGCIATVLGAAGTAYGLTIDDFVGAMPGGAILSDQVGKVSVGVLKPAAAIGGSRAVLVEQMSSVMDGDVQARTTSSGSFLHSTTVGVVGRSQLIWDGDSIASGVSYAGLGGINLIQDKGTAIVLGVRSFDFANGLPLTIAVRIYDSTDPAGGRYTESSVTLQSVITSKEIELPFVSFIPSDTKFSLTTVGAITVTIQGGSDTDLSLDFIKTNGTCSLIPNAQGRVFDDCGVCGGTNQNKDSCGVCFGNNKDKDSCGVCFGNNRDVDNCGVCGGMNKSKDLCGICGGNNSSCADCTGVPYGPAKKDVCGVCKGDGKSCADCKGVSNGPAKLDQCGVCDGDGKSCIQCEDKDLAPTIAKLKAKAKEQHANGLFFIQRIAQADKRFAASAKKTMNTLYAKMLEEIDSFAVRYSVCQQSVFCAENTENVQKISTYQKSVTELYTISIQVLNRKINQGDGVCRGTIAECKKREQERASNKRTLQQLARRIRNENITISKEVPLSFSVCS
jgi:hypothetical protein